MSSDTKTAIVNLKGRKPQLIGDGEVYIGRAINMGGWRLPASPWANPFRGERADVVKKYEAYLRAPAQMALRERLGELAGKTLCCWCAPEVCHGDVLIKMIAESATKTG